MNEKQKKIMVPYEEKTDTCPDCSNEVCDCGLPAGDTPTPRTDFAIKASNGQWNFVLKLCSERLERELTAAREELADWHNAAEQVKAEYPDEVHCSCVAILRKQLKDVTEQRDRLAEACKLLMAIVGEPNSSVDSCWASEDEMDAAWNMGNEALAAVKGGADDR